MECPPEHMVRLAVGVLKDDAQIWWASVLHTYFLGRVAEQISWDEFLLVFHAKIFPFPVLEQKVDELYCLTQGSMSVTEYATRFMYLERALYPECATCRRRHVGVCRAGADFTIHVVFRGIEQRCPQPAPAPLALPGSARPTRIPSESQGPRWRTAPWRHWQEQPRASGQRYPSKVRSTQQQQ